MSDGWYYVQGEKRSGPVTLQAEKAVGPIPLKDLKVILSTNPDPHNLRVWRVGFPEWTVAGAVKELSALISSPPQIPANIGRTTNEIRPLPSTYPSPLVAQRERVHNTSIRLYVRVAALIVGLFLFMLGRGMQVAPDASEQIAGMVLHLVIVLLVFLIFFQWRRTAVTAPGEATHVRILGGLYIAFGLIAVASLQMLLSLGALDNGGVGEAFRKLLAHRFDSIGTFVIFALAASEIIIGAGLLLNARWARFLARIIAVPVSLGWPVGLALALYTWWSLNPNRDTKALSA